MEGNSNEKNIWIKKEEKRNQSRMWILAGAGILIILVGGNLILQMSERRNECEKNNIQYTHIK